MVLLGRKTNGAKWRQVEHIWESEGFSHEDISADAITIDLQTKNNALSFWEIEDADSLEDVVLALMSTAHNLASIDVLAIPSESIKELGLDIKPTPGSTFAEGMVESHRNIGILNLKKLGGIADLFISEYKLDKVKRFTRKQVKRILKDAISDGRLNKDALDSGLSSKLE